MGDWLNVDMVPDTSKYGMPLPEDLEDILADDPEFPQPASMPCSDLANAADVIHQIASSAKTAAAW